MLFSASAASQEKLNADPREPHLPGPGLGARPVVRPLVPVTLALMAGMAAAGLGPAPAGALAAGGRARSLGRPGPSLVAAASGPVSAPDLFRASGGGFLPAGPAAGFSSRAPRQTAPAPKPDHLRPSEPPRQAGGGTGPALHGGRGLAESLGLAASVREPPGAGPGAGAPAGGHRPGGQGAPGPAPDAAKPRHLQPAPVPGGGRALPGGAAVGPGPPHLSGPPRKTIPGPRGSGGASGSGSQGWTRPSGPSIWPCSWGTRARSPRRCARISPAPAPATCW